MVNHKKRKTKVYPVTKKRLFKRFHGTCSAYHPVRKMGLWYSETPEICDGAIRYHRQECKD